MEKLCVKCVATTVLDPQQQLWAKLWERLDGEAIKRWLQWRDPGEGYV